jgi:hypothetical protein
MQSLLSHRVQLVPRGTDTMRPRRMAQNVSSAHSTSQHLETLQPNGAQGRHTQSALDLNRSTSLIPRYHPATICLNSTRSTAQQAHGEARTGRALHLNSLEGPDCSRGEILSLRVAPREPRNSEPRRLHADLATQRALVCDVEVRAAACTPVLYLPCAAAIRWHGR